ncbi:ionotropic receptor 93a-like [Procambarus clarkii]|uniref:ionotropic receptor 93a-like n=1 Tax=Procambarus clarkii TaxID=6728 RepID=UPI00374222AD
MMNAMLLVLDEWSRFPRRCDVIVSVYVNLPYSASGARIVRIAWWTAARGLLLPTYPLFPDKFNNFYGATVNVTALPYKPFWSEAKDQGSGGVTRYSGSDAQMLMTIAEALNFTFNVLPVTTWDQVTGLVSERTSFMASINHVQMPQRQLLYDYTFSYEHDSIDFTLATPSLISNWQSLYSPLTDTVWASVIASLVLVPVLLFLIGRPKHGEEHSGGISMADAAEIAVGALLGQGTNKHLPGSSSSRVLLVTWLVFSFVVGTVYRGNLTAALTMPKYPPRPETLQQLVKAVHKVTMPSFGESFRQFFKQSDSEVFQALSRLMEIVPSAEYGLQQVVEKKQAFMDGRLYLKQTIADHYTRVDGSTILYVGRESAVSSTGAWPIPHDAPYKPQLDRIMMFIIEAGLYEKWVKDVLEKAKQESRRRVLESQESAEERASLSETDTNSNQALTLRHMQGPFLLLVLGLVFSLIVLVSELLFTLFTIL